MKKMEKALLSWSSVKDSAMALYEIQRSRRYEVASLLTTVTDMAGFFLVLSLATLFMPYLLM